MTIQISQSTTVNTGHVGQTDSEVETEGLHTQFGKAKVAVSQAIPLSLQNAAFDLSAMEEMSMVAASLKKDKKSEKESLKEFQEKLASKLLTVQNNKNDKKANEELNSALNELKDLANNQNINEEKILDFISRYEGKLKNSELYEIIDIITQTIGETNKKNLKMLETILSEKILIIDGKKEVFEDIKSTLENTFSMMEIGSLKSLHSVVINNFKTPHPEGINWAISYFSGELAKLSNCPDPNHLQHIRLIQNQISAATTIYEKCTYISEQTTKLIKSG